MKKVKVIACILGILIFQLKSYTQSYDILIKNGHVIDVKNNINKVIDIAIDDNKIALVQENISVNSSIRIIDAKGLYVTPGLIDIHSHNFHGTIPNRYSVSYTHLTLPTRKLV